MGDQWSVAMAAGAALEGTGCSKWKEIAESVTWYESYEDLDNYLTTAARAASAAASMLDCTERKTRLVAKAVEDLGADATFAGSLAAANRAGLKDAEASAVAWAVEWADK